MARGESRKRKPGTPDYRKRFWAAVTAIVVTAGSIGVSHAGFTLPNQAQKQVQMAAAETEPAEQTAKKQVPNAAKRSLELEDAQGIQEADAAAVADQSELESDKTTASGFRSVDETVYATENLLNVRSGCGTEYEIVTQLNQGDSVQRVGIGDGWSEVLYKDKSCFIRSEYLTTTEPGSEEATVTAQGAEADAQGAPVSNGRIVAIDAGHQAKGNPDKEPVGPGSSTMKAKVASGTEGVSTKLPEYELTLSVSKKLKRILEERGYQVVMIRESNDVNLSNAERAEIANKSGASIFVLIHGNSLDNTTVNGTLSMCQTATNPYNGGLHAASYSLSKKITDSVCAATGFKNRGVQETDSMSGINWCKIPVSIVEMGFMSNPEEDQKMARDDYQELIVGGIANGIDAYYQ